MSRIRALFLGTPDIAKHCLEVMINDPHYEVVGVVTQPDRPAGRKLELQPSPVKKLAVQHNLPVLTPENINTPEVLQQIEALKAEVAVVVAFGQILRKPLLAMFLNRVVNVHASLLPHLRGAAPIQRALINGDKQTGVCLQVMVRKLDAGPILGSRPIELSDEMNAYDLYKQCETLGAQLLTVDLMDYMRGNLTAVPQDESKVTFAAKIEKQEAEIDWNKSATEIHNLIRGLAMGPVAQTRRQGKLLKIHKTRVLTTDGGSAALQPGQVNIPESQEKSLLVQCGKGTLELLDVQPESRGRMPIAEYLRGYPMRTGDAFSAHVKSEPRE
jgi:methionyl-tRNA formyltransferase